MKRDRVGGRRARRRTAPRAVAALLTVAALLGPAGVRAACPGDPPALAEIPPEARIGFLRQALQAERIPAQRWTWFWGIADGALVTAQLAALPFTPERADRAVLAAGAATGALGPLQMVLLPVEPPIARVQESTGPCETVAILERALEHGARNQRLGVAPVAHVVNVVLNIALGIAAGFAAKDWRNGALTFGLGFTLGEAQILTQPTGLVRDLGRYRRGELEPVPAPLTLEAPQALDSDR